MDSILHIKHLSPCAFVKLEGMSEKEINAYLNTLEQAIKNAFQRYDALQKSYYRLTGRNFQWIK